jgi:poly-gamma-glutamate capsule biosynthesis protein CapA/YwtB (metallophosphatase superfamily)
MPSSLPGPRAASWTSGALFALPLLLGTSLSGCGRSTGSPGTEQAIAKPAAPAAAPTPRELPAPGPTEPVTPALVAAVPEKRPVVLVAGGDVNFGLECGQAILADPKYDPFAFVAPLWKSADFRFVNLESQLSDQNGETQSPRNRVIFTGPPGGAGVLASAGIDVVTTANNHAWDYGKAAFLETLDHLKAAGVQNVGTGRTLEEAHAPVVLEANGIKIAIFAVTHIWNQGPIEEHAGRKHVAWAKWTAMQHRVARVRRDVDFVLLAYHGGGEYIDVPLGMTRRFVKAAMKAGVDAIIGHHPHVPQGVGWFSDRPVFYSLGNFVFAGHAHRTWTNYGMLARLTLKPDRTLEAQACPYVIEGHTPKPLPAENPANQTFREHLRFTSANVGGSEVGEPGADGCFAVAPPIPRKPPPPGPLRADRESRPLVAH